MNSKLFNVRICSASAVVLVILAAMSCGPIQSPAGSGTNADFTEGAQQIGDTMASVDESGGSTGNYGLIEGARRTFARLAPATLTDRMFNELIGIPSAEAATCSTASTFSACTGGVIVRNFGGCTIGAATFTGTATFTYSNAATCQIPAVNDFVTRVPAFTVTGLRNATLTVSKPGAVGQKITRLTLAPATFSFTNDGIERKFTVGSTTLFDFTTATASAITISSSARSGRVISGGSLQVVNNLTGVTCTYVPAGVTWGATCNCASAGSWTATCTDGKTSSVNITGCGTANFTLGTQTGSMTFDRCYGS